ncbi:MAG: helix-turn-helix domain-containing protein [Bacilli bacterium]|nr:helix-turn-helix domain-containing protein [Bacilli bacterium]MDD4608461.1 helix-turn-helix domain-containing protein [Bacilli bacterium]
MKFGENLQAIRKEHKLSQEQLAEKLYVSRQAVSKWESGQSYPEMDKIISMCKIFNCSIDELVNEANISNKESNKKGKYNFNNYLEEVLNFVSQTIEMIMRMSFTEIIRCGFELLAIAFILFAFKIPVDYIGSLGNRLFSLLPNILSSFIIPLWSFVLNLSYFILAIIVFIHIFKTRYLDSYDVDEVVPEEEKVIEEVKEKKDVKSEKIPKVKKSKEKRSMTFAISSLLSQIISVLIRALTVTITIPFLMSLLMFTIFLVISIGLLFKGIIYLGILIALIAALVFNIVLVETLFNIIFSRKTDLKKIFITLLGTIIGLGVGIGITTFDVANSKIINEVPESIKLTTKVDEIKMNNELVLNSWHNVNFIYDDSLKDNIKIEIKYYENYIKASYRITGGNYFDVYKEEPNQILFSDLYHLIINDLKKKTFHNYNLLSEFTVNIHGSTKNIEKIKSNTQKYYNELQIEERNNQAEIDYYRSQLDTKNTKIYELESQLELKEFELQQSQSKIQEYKNKINGLITE